MIIFHWIKTRIKLIKKHLGDPFSTGCLCQADVVKTLKVRIAKLFRFTSTGGAFRRPMTYENHPVHKIHKAALIISG